MTDPNSLGDAAPIFHADRELIEIYGAPIAPFFSDSSITSIMVNRYDQVFIRRDGKFVLTEARWRSERELINFIKQTARNLGQDADENVRPISDARMPDGSRINAVMYPVAHRGSNMTIRLFPKVRFTVEDLLERGMFSSEMLAFLRAAVAVQANMLVAGASGSGKTTVLNALGNIGPPETRTAVIEDTSELWINKLNVLYMEASRRAVVSDDPVTMERLLVNLLRQECDAVMVGECREPKTATALQIALNTGHRGVLTTIHASSDEKALRRLEFMLLANDSRVPFEAVREDIRASIDVVIYAERTPRHGQRIVHLSEVDENGQLRRLFEWDYATGAHVRVFSGTPRIAKAGIKYGIDFEALVAEAAAAQGA